MAPGKIRLVDVKTRKVDWHDVATLPWDGIWTISHIWDKPSEEPKITIPLDGISWKSDSFSTIERFELMFKKALQVVEPYNAKYVWFDTACINQEDNEEREDSEKKVQIPFMGTVYSQSAGSVAFGTLTTNNQFVEIVSTHDDGQKAWVCDWFQRVWTFQELQLPKKLFFVSGEQVLSRDQVYFRLLMMSPYLTSPVSSTPSPNFALDPNISYVHSHDVLNALSPLSKFNVQRSLMQTSKRGCRRLSDKVYGILGILPEQLRKLPVDYKLGLPHTLLDLMVFMSPNDVLDTLTFNTLPPADGIHDTVRWSGMVRLDEPMEHPSYEKDIYHPATDALVAVLGKPPRAQTIVYNARLWEVLITKAERTEEGGVKTQVQAWPSIAALAKHFKLKDDFSKVEPNPSAEHADVIGRAERSLVANRDMVKPFLEEAAEADVGKEISAILDKPPTNSGPGGLPTNRLGDKTLFGKQITVFVCRSKASKSFHYGIVVTQNKDGTWHKVCTAAFSDSCVVARDRVENLVVIGQ